MGFLRAALQRLGLLLGGFFTPGRRRYLCDTCRWDYGDACTRPERPNARACPDYKRR